MKMRNGVKAVLSFVLAAALFLAGTGAAAEKEIVFNLAVEPKIGGDLEYADKLTLLRSFRGRIAL